MDRSEPDRPGLPRGNEYFQALDLREGLRRKAASGAMATIGAHFSAHITQVVGSVILARLLQPDDFGLVIMAATFVLLLMNFGMNGFAEAVIQQEDLGRGQVSALFWINVGVSTALMLALMALSPLVAWFYGRPELVPITMVMSLSILFSGLSTQHVALLKRNMRFHLTSANELGAWVLSYVVGIILAMIGFGYWALVAKQIFFPFAYSAGGWILCGWRPGRPSMSGGVGKMVRFALNTSGTFALSYFEKNLDKVLIGRVHGAQPLGNYDRAYSLFALPVSQITVPLSNVSLATLSRLRGDPPRFHRAYLKAVSLIAFVGMLLSALLTVVGYDLILLLLGPKWEQAGVLFCIIAPSAGVFLVSSTNGWLHLSLGRAGNWLRWSIFASLFSAALCVAGLPYGAAGVAMGRVVSVFALAVPGLWYAGKPIGLKVSAILQATWKYYASSLLSGLCSWALLQGLDIQGASWGTLCLRVLLGSSSVFLLYLLFTTALFHGTGHIAEFVQILRESLGGMRAESRA